MQPEHLFPCFLVSCFLVSLFPCFLAFPLLSSLVVLSSGPCKSPVLSGSPVEPARPHVPIIRLPHRPWATPLAPPARAVVPLFFRCCHCPLLLRSNPVNHLFYQARRSPAARRSRVSPPIPLMYAPPARHCLPVARLDGFRNGTSSCLLDAYTLIRVYCKECYVKTEFSGSMPGGHRSAGSDHSPGNARLAPNQRGEGQGSGGASGIWLATRCAPNGPAPGAGGRGGNG